MVYKKYYKSDADDMYCTSNKQLFVNLEEEIFAAIAS